MSSAPHFSLTESSSSYSKGIGALQMAQPMATMKLATFRTNCLPPHLRVSQFPVSGRNRERITAMYSLMKLRRSRPRHGIRWAECARSPKRWKNWSEHIRRVVRDYRYRKRKRIQSRSSPESSCGRHIKRRARTTPNRCRRVGLPPYRDSKLIARSIGR